MVSRRNYNLNANEGFVMVLTSKLIACFIDVFTSKRKSQSIAYLLDGSEHVYWILDLEEKSTQYGSYKHIQLCKGNFIFRSRVEWATVSGQDLRF
jgi:hypothetical protein